MNFEEAYKRLREISVEMDSKDLPLDKAVALYSEAAKLVEVCRESIEKAKLEVKTVDGTQ